MYSNARKKDIIQTAVLDFPHKLESKTTQLLEIDSTQIIGHKTIQTIEQTTTIVTLDHVKFPEIKTTLPKSTKNLLSVTAQK